ncbi:hypothetical protein GC207_10420 [bacterium]|nr:hypothetical protein [bacterium]
MFLRKLFHAAAVVFVLSLAATQAAEITIPDSAWHSWSPRDDIAPVFKFDSEVGHSGPGSFYIEPKGNPAAFGAWTCVVTNFVPGKTYRFEVWYRTVFTRNPVRSVIPRLEWQDSQGRAVRPPDFAIGKPQADGWSKVAYVTTAPDDARQVKVELGFGFDARGFVWFDDVKFVQESKPPDRVVRVATIHHRPHGNSSAAENVEEFAKYIGQAGEQHPDIICLPEGMTEVGTGLSYVEVSESIPGPTTIRLGELAAKYHTYIVAGIYESSGKIVYNTAVLIDRQGNVAGKYCKTHLPREEWEAGLTPGDEYPVFDTDFGKVGLFICWDVQFPEPARAMALKGAELLLLPIWGGSDVLTRARAIENHVYLVSSTYDMRSFVVDPTGEVLAEATDKDPVAIAEVHLDKTIIQPWLGNMKYRTWKERRPDIKVE